ncbi:RNA-directed DNA polymerase, eukaryota, partial [Tanacetum coccineum]
MARFTSMAMLNVVLLIVIMMAGATKTSAGGVCHDLIPLTPAVCNEDVISNDCWDACHKKFGPTAVPGSFMISHLFYADDAIFVGEWNDKNIQTLLNVLKCFYLASGLKINLHKSKLMGIGVNTSTIESAANLIGCAILHPPFNYLGVKVGCNMNRISSWDEVISKVSSRLSKWKLKYLSIGGRLTL